MLPYKETFEKKGNTSCLISLFWKIYKKRFDEFEFNRSMKNFYNEFTKKYKDLSDKSYGKDPKDFYNYFLNEIIDFLQVIELKSIYIFKL